jgi:hypothetical protein
MTVPRGAGGDRAPRTRVGTHMGHPYVKSILGYPPVSHFQGTQLAQIVVFSKADADPGRGPRPSVGSVEVPGHSSMTPGVDPPPPPGALNTPPRRPPRLSRTTFLQPLGTSYSGTQGHSLGSVARQGRGP